MFKFVETGAIDPLGNKVFKRKRVFSKITKIKKSAPRFGFGSETRSSVEKAKMTPGPGNYKLKPLIGEEGKKNSIHGTIDYTPEKKEQSYKPGPGNYNPDY